MKTASIVHTQKVAEGFAKRLNPGDTVCLFGNLGSGKTTFVQSIAKEFGITRRIISPTFVIIRTYKLKNKKIKKFYHVDLYRLSDQRDIASTGLLEILKEKDSIVAIEWAEKMGELLPKTRNEVRFGYGRDENERIIIFKKYE